MDIDSIRKKKKIFCFHCIANVNAIHLIRNFESISKSTGKIHHFVFLVSICNWKSGMLNAIRRRPMCWILLNFLPWNIELDGRIKCSAFKIVKWMKSPSIWHRMQSKNNLFTASLHNNLQMRNENGYWKNCNETAQHTLTARRRTRTHEKRERERAIRNQSESKSLNEHVKFKSAYDFSRFRFGTV